MPTVIGRTDSCLDQPSSVEGTDQLGQASHVFASTQVFGSLQRDQVRDIRNVSTTLGHQRFEFSVAKSVDHPSRSDHQRGS